MSMFRRQAIKAEKQHGRPPKFCPFCGYEKIKPWLAFFDCDNCRMRFAIGYGRQRRAKPVRRSL